MSGQKSTPWTPLTKTTNTKENEKSGPTLSSNRGHAALVVPTLEYKQIQADELEVLRSVFMDDYKHVEKVGAWNLSEHAFTLRLRAPSDEQYSCVLSVELPTTYPKTAPEITVKGSAHIRSHQVERIKTILKDLPQRLMGQEMMYEIAIAVQDALEDIVQNRLVDQGKPSLGQERALKAIILQKQVEEEKEETLRLIEKTAEEEQQKLEKEIEDELNRQRQKAKKSHQKRRSQLLVDESPSISDTEDCLLFDRTIKINQQNGNESFSFRKVCGMVKIAQGPATTVYTVRPAFPAHERNNYPLVLKQADLSNHFSDSPEVKLRIQNLEQEIDSLRNLKHPNVVTVYESKITQVNDGSRTNTSPGPAVGWKVSILMEYANKGSLHSLLETVDCLSVDVARSWTIALLEGLDYIHRNGAIHRSINPTNVLLFRSSSRNHTIPKHSDIGYAKSFRDITQDKPINTRIFKPAPWTSPELTQQDCMSTGKGTRKADIWDMGILFLQMIFGLDVIKTYDSPKTLMDGLNLSDSLSDFLESIFKPDPKNRPSAFDLLPSEFLRNDDPITFTDPPPVPTNPSKMPLTINSHRVSSRHQINVRREPMVGAGGLSRYASDFVELGRLGKGGYGKVVKARNRLDGREYAIKQITQTSGAKLTEILSEVMMLSRLNHRYVVRYFTAWLEDHDSLQGTGIVRDTEDDSNTISSSEGSTLDSKYLISGQSDEKFQDNISEYPIEQPERNEGLGGIEDVEIEFGESTGGLDFISNSTGYPPIQFGYSSGESGDSDGEVDEEDSTESRPSTSFHENELRRTVSNEKRRGRVTLYIQMSLAERLTLRDRIRQGIKIEESWKLFRQILEGLAHIHGLGIIHRDLKPENIFIDFSGDPQIGDFGLATNDLINSSLSNDANQNYSENDLTTNVGTALYVAPEIRSHGRAKYDDKVDMYSLGIIFFEMIYPLNSGMERAQVLTNLREPTISCPTDFRIEERAVQGNIIKTLLCHSPGDRPSSSELLNSSQLPFMIEDKTIKHALQSLSDPSAPYHSQVMQALFSQKTKAYKDHTYDTEKKALASQDLLLQTLVKERLTSIFRNHGAVEASRPLLLPRSRFYSRDVVQLIDTNGTLVQLPYDLTLPHARFLARETVTTQKSFTFGDVYREKYGGGQPRSHGEVDFDIVSNGSQDLALKDAEVIKVIDEVIDAFPSLRSVQMCYHINHSSLLDAIMDFCRIEIPARAHAKEILSKLNHGYWDKSKIRNELAAAKLGILPTSLDDLFRFDWQMEPIEAIGQLTTIFEETSLLNKMKPVFAHIREVVTYIRYFEVHRKLYVSPLGTWNDKFYRGGIVFQCIYDTKKRDVFAAGGRYDSLIQDHRPKMHGHAETHAVGCNLGWEQLFTSMAKYNRNFLKSALSKHNTTEEDHRLWNTRRCDVIVSAFENSALGTQAITVLQELWANGIRADLGKRVIGGENLSQQYKNDGASWIVIVKQGAISGERSLKIKGLLTKVDVELKVSELITWLKTEISERDRKSIVAERSLPRLSRHVPMDSFVYDEQQGAMDVRIITSRKGGRKINRQAVIEATQRTASEVSASYLKCPILAVELRDEIIDDIKAIGLQDLEGWKRLAHNVNPNERKYIIQVQEELEALKSEGHRQCWIFGFRTKAGGIFHLQP